MRKNTEQKLYHWFIEQQLDHWFDALKTGNPDKVTHLYSDDAVLLSTLQGDVKTGHPQIRDYFASYFLPKNPHGKIVESHTRLLGSIAINSGIYAFDVGSKEDKSDTVEARYTFVYQWIDDDWKIIEHHSSLRPA